jgi:hypothetical protein
MRLHARVDHRTLWCFLGPYTSWTATHQNKSVSAADDLSPDADFVASCDCAPDRVDVLEKEHGPTSHLADPLLGRRVGLLVERNHQGTGNPLITPEEPHIRGTEAFRRRQRLGGMPKLPLSSGS